MTHTGVVTGVKLGVRGFYAQQESVSPGLAQGLVLSIAALTDGERHGQIQFFY